MHQRQVCIVCGIDVNGFTKFFCSECNYMQCLICSGCKNALDRSHICAKSVDFT